MNISVVVLCFALGVQLVAGRAKAKLLFFYVCFVLLTNASLHSFEQRQKVRVFLIIFTGILMPYS